MKPGDALVVEARELDALLGALRERGHTLLGPTVRDGAIVLDEIGAATDLPVGWADEQDGGRYRLRRRGDGALFGYAVGAHAWKRYLHPPAVVRWRARRADGGFVAEPETAPPPRYAFVGVRPCELAAILVQDRVFLGGSFVDPAYRSRRESAFVLAVDCGSPAGTCFCASMGTGPKAGPGFDLALTELIDGGRHELVVEVGTERGAEVAGAVPHRPAEPADLEAARAVVARAEGAHGPGARHRGPQGPALPPLRGPPVGRGGEALPGLLELHDGLPDLLLRDGRGRDRPPGHGHRAAADLGLLLLAGVLLRPRRQRAHLRGRALPAVDHAQAGDLARPVRRLGLRRLRALHHVVPRGHRHHGGGPGRAPGRSARELTVTIHTFEKILGEHPFFKDLSDPHLDTVVGCVANVVFQPGEFIFREGEAADHFFVVREGKVAVEVFVPNKGPVTIETIEGGEMLGWSWLFPPYKARFDARALNAVRALSLDGACLRTKCEKDPALGYELLKRFTEVVVSRLEATRMQLLDLYGND